MTTNIERCAVCLPTHNVDELVDSTTSTSMALRWSTELRQSSRSARTAQRR